MPAKKPSRTSEGGHRVEQTRDRAGLTDVERVRDAMRSGEWLRTTARGA
jgi:hypothetical protein